MSSEEADNGAVESLPMVIPVFPLTGAVLMPETQLPLNIFEPRYLAMVKDARSGDGLIGMVQPRPSKTGEASDGANPPLYQIGTVGVISQFEETGDGRLQIVLDGISRFRILEELTVTTPYRQVRVDWSPFALDGEALNDLEQQVDRATLMASLKIYLADEGLHTDFSALEEAPTTPLIANLAAALPFEPAEKQALLEAQTVAARADIMQALFDMAGTEQTALN